MPRYFFDIVDGEILRDEVGVPLESLADARAQAVVILAGALMTQPAVEALAGPAWRVDVRDEAGAPAFSLEYRATSAP